MKKTKGTNHMETRAVTAFPSWCAMFGRARQSWRFFLLLPTCAQAHHSLSSSPEGKDAPPFVARCSGRMRLCCGPRMYSYSLSTASGYKRVLPSSQGGSEKALAHRRGG